MSRKYNEKLVENIRTHQYIEKVNGVDVTYKPIPDCNIPGAMDTRLYQNSKKTSWLMKFIPKRMLQFDTKNIERLRKVFNKVDSTTFVSGVSKNEQKVKAKDGFEIPITIFKGKNTLENAPILYFIHGGGFFAGSTDVVSEALNYIVERTGIIAVSVDYRLAPENPFPTGHEDVYTVLKWIYKHAVDFGGDKENIFISGDSAGGNLALYCSNKSIEEEKEYIKGQIILYPTVNMGGIEDPYVNFSIDDIEIYERHRKLLLPGLTMMDGASGSLSKLLGTDDVMNLYLTPYLEVSPKMPVTLISCGEHDSLITESLAYAKKLVEQGVDTTFTLYKGMGHAYIDHMGNYPQAEDCAIDIGEFILAKSTR